MAYERSPIPTQTNPIAIETEKNVSPQVWESFKSYRSSRYMHDWQKNVITRPLATTSPMLTTGVPALP